MTDLEKARFEAELRALTPTVAPRQIVSETLRRIKPQVIQQRRGWDREGLFGWLIPAAGLALVIGAVILLQIVPGQGSTKAATSSISTPIKADQVELNRQLVANYDAVGRLPNGEPIRFRCAQWMDKVSLRDSAAGLVIERTTPRLEIVPIGIETY